jgi:hypothetical protein
MKLALLSSASLICISITFSSLSAATTKIYHWVDEQGKSHYSDTADLGTEEIHVINENIVTSNNIPPPTMAKNTANVKNEPAIIYQADITSPQDNIPLRSNDGSIDIQVKITPEKDPAHKLQLFLDGKALGKPQISSTIRAANIDRGTHQIQVHLLDESGKVLARTQVVTLHLQRISIGSAP